ncbi:hypothetical protein ACUN0C_11890 [Faunimonas sp. B44]|uniref:hypothetical protein n=1 Tax=Faunimonas sp. B44 TaxID=3461493 RepID=UPI004044C958
MGVAPALRLNCSNADVGLPQAPATIGARALRTERDPTRRYVLNTIGYLFSALRRLSDLDGDASADGCLDDFPGDFVGGHATIRVNPVQALTPSLSRQASVALDAVGDQSPDLFAHEGFDEREVGTGHGLASLFLALLSAAFCHPAAFLH